MKKIFSFLLFISLFFAASAQTDTCSLRISLLTCSPGTELYSTFGHSALRVVDKLNNTDSVFNYGTFDFDDPDFYTKFTRGKLLYFVSVTSFSDFMLQYQYERRGVTEQVLNLSCEEKQNLLAALNENAKDENKYYKYDFVYDNCTTRLRDLVAKGSKDPVVTKDIRPGSKTTFRKLIHEYLDKGKEYWSELGIDILLGSPLDKKISNSEAMFLPDYLLKGFDSTTIGQRKLVADKIQILNPTFPQTKKTILTPLFIFCSLLLIILILSFNKHQSVKISLRFFDFILFFLCGALGSFLLFLWFGTDHSTCKWNFNLLWAFPFHVVIAFFINSKKQWVNYYFAGTILLFIFLLLFGSMLQSFNIALIPIMTLLLIRSIAHYKKYMQ